ncbi:MAG: biotin--[acetyl-CoA-carboxylase] ligase [Leptolyngbyaceae cyanobacterium]
MTPEPSPASPDTWTTLDSETIRSYLSQLATTFNGQPELVPTFTDSPIYLYDSVESTNPLLWQTIRQSGNNQSAWLEGMVAIARQQSAGKGQWGRQWQSSLGGLYLSMALKPNCPVAAAAQITLSVVVGVAIALRRCHLPVLIKWPNDLVVPASALDHSITREQEQSLYKLGGILTETRLQGNTIRQAVVGIGINGANPVPPQGITVQALGRSCQQEQSMTSAPTSSQVSSLVPLPMSLNGMGAIAIWGIRSGWRRWQQQGIAPILADYNHLLSHRGQTVSTEYDGQKVQGHVIGVSASGHLRVRCDSLPSPRPVSSEVPPRSSSSLQLSSSEIQLPPGRISLGYQLDAQF